MNKADFRTGDIVPTGSNAGWLYCEGKDLEPFLVAPQDSGVMKWHEAVDYATRANSELPSREHLDAMFGARHEKCFKDTFIETGEEPQGWYWSSTENISAYDACSQTFSDRLQSNIDKDLLASFRLVRPFRMT